MSLSMNSPCDRELLGICKQSMLQLRNHLRQYLEELHTAIDVPNLNPYILTAALEFCSASDVSAVSPPANRSAPRATPLTASLVRSSTPINRRPESSCNNISLGNLSHNSVNERSLLKRKYSESNDASGMDVPQSDLSDQSPIKQLDETGCLDASNLSMSSTDYSFNWSASDPMGGLLNGLQPGTSRSTPDSKRKEKRHRIRTSGLTETEKQCFYCDWKVVSLGDRPLIDHLCEAHSELVEPTASPVRYHWFYTCRFCATKISTFPSLRRHMNNSHSLSAKMYQCQECDYSCKRKDNLRAHIRKRHPERLPPDQQYPLPGVPIHASLQSLLMAASASTDNQQPLAIEDTSPSMVVSANNALLSTDVIVGKPLSSIDIAGAETGNLDKICNVVVEGTENRDAMDMKSLGVPNSRTHISGPEDESQDASTSCVSLSRQNSFLDSNILLGSNGSSTGNIYKERANTSSTTNNLDSIISNVVNCHNTS